MYFYKMSQITLYKKLSNDILRHIYEYDNTYKVIFSKK